MTDPLEEYLAKKAAQTSAPAPAAEPADPLEAYLAKKTAAPTEAAAPAPAEPPKPGFFRRAADSLVAGTKAIGSVARDQVKAVNPLELFSPEGRARVQERSIFTNPAKRHEFERGVDDVVTLGYGQRLAARAGNALGDVGRGTSLDETKHFSPDIGAGDTHEVSKVQAAEAAAAPAYRPAGQVLGTAIPNPVGELTGGVLRPIVGAAGRAAPAVAKVVQKAAAVPVAGNVAKSLVNYEANAPLQAALSADSEGHRLAAAGQAFTDPLGVSMATVLGAGASARNKVLNSEGAKSRRYIEQHGEGARVGPLTSGKGGVFQNQLAGLKPDDAGIGNAGLRGARAIVDDVEARHQAEQGYPYRGGKALVREASETSKEAASRGRVDIALAREERRANVEGTQDKILQETAQRSKKLIGDISERKRADVSEPYRVVAEQIHASPEAGKTRDVAPIVATMQDAVDSLSTRDFARERLKTMLNLLEKKRDPRSGAVMLTERDINDLRENLMDSAKVKQTDAPGKAEAPLRAAAFAAKEMVDQGPYAALNRAFSEGATEIEQQRKGVGLKKKPGRDAAAEEEGLTKRLRKAVGDPTQIPAGKNAPPEAQLGRLRQELRAAKNTAQPTVERVRTENQQARDALAQARAKRAAGDTAALKDRELLGLSPSVSTRKADVNQVRLALTRRGQNTETAGGSQADLEAYGRAHPDQETNTRLAELMRNRAALQFGLGPGGHGGVMSRLRHGALTTIKRNAAPISGRLLYGPAHAVDPIALAAALGRLRGAQTAKEKRP